MIKKIIHHGLALIIAVFYIQPAEAALNVSVVIEGIEGELKENVRALLSIEYQKNHPDLTENQLWKLHKQAPDEIRVALQPFGYYGPDIKADLVRKESGWNAVYSITPGNPVIIDNVELLITGPGRDHERFKKLAGSFPVRKNAVLNHPDYEKAKRLLHDTAMNFGFLGAKMLKSTVEVHAGQAVSNIIIHFDTGPQYRFGKVTFAQNGLSQEFLDRFMPFRQGEPYLVSKILDFQSALNNSDYFESVEIAPRAGSPEEIEVPIEVNLVPRRRHKYKFGLGYGTDTGLRGTAGWEISRINDTGHRFGITLKVSEIKSGIVGEYTVPLRDPRTDSLAFTAGYSREDTQTSFSEKLFGGIRFNHVRAGWKESLSLDYEEELFTIAGDEGRSTLLIPGIGWTKVWSDNPVQTKRGLRIFLDARGAHESILSDNSFLQIRSQMKYIRRLWAGSRIIMRAEGGVSVVSEFSELPASVRFFAGGDQSVRGYAYNSLGPEDESGDVVGGRHLIAGSIEYEQNVSGDWSAALFYDAGNAIDSISDPIESGAGFGVRWQSPVGPVRVDLAFPLSGSDKDWRIHLVVGPDL